MKVLDRVLRAGDGKRVKALQGLVPDINALESEMPQRGAAVDELPEISKAAVADLEKVGQRLLTEGKSLTWENGPHMWQVSVWEDNSPETRIIVPFGKRGVNRSHLVKWEGNEELALALWARFQMEVKK